MYTVDSRPKPSAGEGTSVNEITELPNLAIVHQALPR